MHRTVRTKGCLSHGMAMSSLITTASKTWRRLMGNNQLPKVIEGVRFKAYERNQNSRRDQRRHPKSGITLAEAVPANRSSSRATAARWAPWTRLPAMRRLGFMEGQVTIPEDFDRIGAAEIEAVLTATGITIRAATTP